MGGGGEGGGSSAMNIPILSYPFVSFRFLSFRLTVISRRSFRRRFSSSMTDDASPKIHLRKLSRKKFDSSRSFGLNSQHMNKYQHQMEDADHEKDLDLSEGTHMDVIKQKFMKKKQRERENGHMTIVTEADEIKRRFSSVMSQKAQVDDAVMKHMAVLAEDGGEEEGKKTLGRKSSSGNMRRSMSVSSMGSFVGSPKGKMKKKKKKKYPEKWSELRLGR